MVLRAALLLDQILEKVLADDHVLGVRVHPAQKGRKGQSVVVVLARVFFELGARQLARAPALIKGVIEQMALLHFLIERADHVLHITSASCDFRRRYHARRIIAPRSTSRSVSDREAARADGIAC